jgi:hypothetical protein
MSKKLEAVQGMSPQGRSELLAAMPPKDREAHPHPQPTLHDPPRPSHQPPPPLRFLLAASFPPTGAPVAGSPRGDARCPRERNPRPTHQDRAKSGRGHDRRGEPRPGRKGGGLPTRLPCWAQPGLPPYGGWPTWHLAGQGTGAWQQQVSPPYLPPWPGPSSALNALYYWEELARAQFNATNPLATDEVGGRGRFRFLASPPA